MLIDPPEPTNYSAAHPTGLVLSKEVVILDQYKLIIAQNFGWPPVNGWRNLDGSWVESQGNTDNASACLQPDVAPSNDTYLGGLPGRVPCLFDIRADMRELQDIATSEPAIVAKLWERLNLTVLTQRDCSAVGCENAFFFKFLLDKTILYQDRLWTNVRRVEGKGVYAGTKRAVRGLVVAARWRCSATVIQRVRRSTGQSLVGTRMVLCAMYLAASQLHVEDVYRQPGQSSAR